MANHNIDPNRLYWIDAVRSFACLCVITVHAAAPGGTKGLSVLGPINYFSASGASILFFMISGALVLYRPKPFAPFIRQRLARIVLPMVIWSIVALTLSCTSGDLSWQELPRKIMLIPFYPQTGWFWFIYVIFGIYLITPIVATWLEKCKRHDVEIILGIGAFALAMPYLTYYFGDDLAKSLDPGKGFMYYFGGYLWYAVMGWYLRKYVHIPKFRLWHLAIIACVVALPMLLYQTNIPHKIIQSRTSVNMAMMCACYFIALKHIHYSDTAKKIVYNFAQHSFGIYLIHMIVYNHLLFPTFISRVDIHYGIIIPITVFANAAISYTLVHLMSKLPGSKYIVGL